LQAQNKSISQKVDSVLTDDTGRKNRTDEPVQWRLSHTGPITKDGDKQAQIRNGQIGSMLNVIGVQHTESCEEMAMQSRLKIPLLFGQDVIHGFVQPFPSHWHRLPVGILLPSKMRKNCGD
jgi:beta-glucosidase